MNKGTLKLPRLRKYVSSTRFQNDSRSYSRSSLTISSVAGVTPPISQRKIREVKMTQPLPRQVETSSDGSEVTNTSKILMCPLRRTQVM
jgi:hypothetical protein